MRSSSSQRSGGTGCLPASVGMKGKSCIWKKCLFTPWQSRSQPYLYLCALPGSWQFEAGFMSCPWMVWHQLFLPLFPSLWPPSLTSFKIWHQIQTLEPVTIINNKPSSSLHLPIVLSRNVCHALSWQLPLPCRALKSLRIQLLLIQMLPGILETRFIFKKLLCFQNKTVQDFSSVHVVIFFYFFFYETSFQICMKITLQIPA